MAAKRCGDVTRSVLEATGVENTDRYMRKLITDRSEQFSRSNK